MSKSEVERLVLMANDIAKNTGLGKTNEEAVAAVKNHILRFWAPGMRNKVKANLATLPVTLHPIARQAFE